MTRGIYGFLKKGEYKLDYVNTDAYPDFWGKLIVKFIQENTLIELHELWNKIYLVDRNGYPSEAQLIDFKDKGLYVEDIENWEHLSVLNGHFIDYYLQGVYFMPDFNKWSQHQDWKYIINLDSDMFEIYSFDNFIKSYPLDKIPNCWIYEV